MVLIGGYEDSMRRLGQQSVQRGARHGNAPSVAAPSYHYDMLQVVVRIQEHEA